MRMQSTASLWVLLLATPAVQAQQASTWSIIRDQIFAENCTSCHVEGSSFARQSGLVLTANVAYQQLLDRPPKNAAARADGLLRVSSGGLEGLHKSFLWEKLDAPNQEHFFSDHPFYGSMMPLSGPPLTNGELELIRRWIVGGAPENTAIPGADATLLADTTRFQNPAFEPLTAPAQGLHFELGPFKVAPNYDREFLYFEPLNMQDDLFVNRIEMALRPGSHHFLFYIFSPDIPPGAVPPPRVYRDFRDLFGRYILQNLAATPYHIFFAGTQWPRMDYHFPEGVALRLPAGYGLDLNSHYANRADSSITGEISANLYTVDRAQVQRVAEILFLNNTDFHLPPQQVTTIEKVYLNPEPENLNVFQLFSHAHEHMTEFRVELSGGPRDGDLVYIADDWEHPPILELDPPLVVRPGEGFKLITTYNNWTDETLGFGLLSSDEMMILFGYYYLGDVITGVAADPPHRQPATFSFDPNYPNPFNPATVLQFMLPEKMHARLEVFDVTGRRVATLLDRDVPAGVHRATFSGAGLPTGMYLARLTAGTSTAVRKMLLIR